MPNHVHLIAVPQTLKGLARAIGEAHRRYTRRINFRENWRGHLWQERFASFPMDESHLLTAARYVEMNPVAANMVEQQEDYPWSSAWAHLAGKDADLVKVKPLLERVGDWRNVLTPLSDQDDALLQKHKRTGRPLGEVSFIEQLEQQTGRTLRSQKPGPNRLLKNSLWSPWTGDQNQGRVFKCLIL